MTYLDGPAVQQFHGVAAFHLHELSLYRVAPGTHLFEIVQIQKL